MDKELETILIQARAKIMWGDSVSEVSDWLRTRGLGQNQIDTIVRTCMAERALEIRRSGVYNIVIGGLLMLLPVVLFLTMSAAGTYYARLLALSFLAGLFGVWRLLTGIGQIVTGSKTGGSLSEM